mgnify:CR=1 FL=1
MPWPRGPAPRCRNCSGGLPGKSTWRLHRTAQAFRNSVGLWKNRADIASGASYVRSLRRGERVKEE